GLARIETKCADSWSVVALVARGAIACRVIYGRRACCAARAYDGDSGKDSAFTHCVIGGAELHRACCRAGNRSLRLEGGLDVCGRIIREPRDACAVGVHQVKLKVAIAC